MRTLRIEQIVYSLALQLCLVREKKKQQKKPANPTPTQKNLTPLFPI